MPFVTTGDGAEIHYEDTGGAGPAVVLIHDIFLDATQWRPQMTSLAPEYRVIVVDTRGHGETVDPGTPYDYAQLGRDVWAVVDGLGIDEVVLGGLFHGGIVSLWAAWIAPERVRGLILVGTRADAYSPMERAGYKAILVNQWALGDQPLEEFAPLIAAQMIGGGDEHRQYWLDKWYATDRRRFELPTRALVERQGIEGHIGEITAPALLVYGAGDVVYTEFTMKELAGQLGGTTRVEMIEGADATHAVTWTHPHLTDPLIREFLATL